MARIAGWRRLGRRAGVLDNNTLTADRRTSPGSRARGLRQLARLVLEHRRGWSRDRGDINMGMRSLLLATVSLVASVAPAANAVAQERAELTMPPNGDNQKAEVSQWIGLVKVTIAYHSPRVHFQGRERTGHIRRADPLWAVR